MLKFLTRTAALCVLALTVVQSCATSQPQDAIPLWADGAPGARGADPVKDVPTLTPFLPAPDKATGGAIIICPGGGYGALAPHEGRDYALWLNERGITGFVLKYRLGSSGYRHPAMMNDVNRAVRLVRSRAAEWKIDPQKIGVMGSSAGGTWPRPRSPITMRGNLMPPTLSSAFHRGPIWASCATRSLRWERIPTVARSAICSVMILRPNW